MFYARLTGTPRTETITAFDAAEKARQRLRVPGKVIGVETYIEKGTRYLIGFEVELRNGSGRTVMLPIVFYGKKDGAVLLRKLEQKKPPSEGLR